MARQRTTRPLSGRITWPFLLNAGVDKSGKTWAAIEASKSDLIGRTFYIPIGEDDADMYKVAGSDRLELVPNDGSYRDILDAVLWATEQPRGENGLPNLVVVDSGSELWDLLTEEQTLIARRRWQKRNPNAKAMPDDDELNITTDQWNVAKSRWAKIVTALRRHDGPAIITAKLEEVTVMQNGQPTTQKEWKVKAEKNLRYAVTGTILMREHRKAILTGIRTTKLAVDPDTETRLRDFSFDSLWRSLGLEDTANIERREVNVTNAAAGADELEAEAAAEQASSTAAASRPAALPDPDVVAQELREAADAADPLAAVREVGNKYGANVLGHLTLTTAKGEEVNAAARVRQMIAYFSGPPAEQDDARPAQEAVRAQDEQPARAAAQPTQPAQEPNARQERARQAHQAAQEKAASIPENDADKRARDMLLSEAEGQAKVLGRSLEQHLAPFMARAPKGVTLDSVPPVPLHNVVRGFRAQVVTALAEAGEATAAEKYGQVTRDRIGWWDDLTGAADGEADAPASETPQEVPAQA